MFTIKSDSDHKQEKEFIKAVGSCYPILIVLYPNKTLTFMDLARVSGTDPGNLSGNIKKLEKNGVIVIHKKKVNGRTRRFISLEPEAVILIKCVKEIKGKQQLPLFQDIKYIDGILDDLLIENVRSLVANQIQRISQNYRIPVTSKYYDFIGNKKKINGLKPVMSILLLSLKNMIHNSNAHERKIIQDKLLNILHEIRDSMLEERPGIIAQDILNEFNWDLQPFENLMKTYVDLFDKSEQEFQKVSVIRAQILERYPEQKINLRDRLIKLAKKAKDGNLERIEKEFELLL